MIKNEHHVLFWEHGQHINDLIPVCETTPLKEVEHGGGNGKNQRSSKRTYSCVSLNAHPEPAPRECRKLLKKGYTWSLCDENNVNTEEEGLDHLLYYRIVIKDTRRVRNRDRTPYKCYFKRLRQLKRLSESCYVADDRCVVLLKYHSPSLKICYLDVLNPGRTYFQKLVILHTGLQMRLCNGALWIVPSPNLTQVCEVLYVLPNSAFSNCTITRHNLSLKYSTLTAFFAEAQCSSDCMFFLKKKKYIAYDAVKHCLVERNIDIPELNELEEFHVLGKMFFAVPIREDKKTEPPVFFTGVMHPEMKITRRIDLSRSLGQYQSYVPGYTEITTHHRGMKALIMSTESYIVVLDLLTGKVSQILSYIPCFWQHQLSIQFSMDGNVIKLLGKYKFTGKTEYLCVNFRTWHGTSLKEMCVRCVSKNFTYDQVLRRNLPRNLLHELKDAYLLKDDIAKS